MCKPGEPCPGAEEAAPKSTTQIVNDQKKYLADITTRLKEAFGEDIAESLHTILHTNLIVDSMFTKIEESSPKLKGADPLKVMMEMILSSLFMGAQQSIWDSFQEINIRFVRQVLDDYGVPNEKRKEHMRLLTEVITATEEFTWDRVNMAAWEIDTSLELGGALSFLYSGVTQATIAEKIPLRDKALAAARAARQPAPATPQ